MTDRPEATEADHYGKFHEHKLRQREEYQSLHAAFLSRHGARQLEFWNRSVLQLRTWGAGDRAESGWC